MQMYEFSFRTSDLQFLMLFGDRRRKLHCRSTWLLVHRFSPGFIVHWFSVCVYFEY